MYASRSKGCGVTVGRWNAGQEAQVQIQVADRCAGRVIMSTGGRRWVIVGACSGHAAEARIGPRPGGRAGGDIIWTCGHGG